MMDDAKFIRTVAVICVLSLAVYLGTALEKVQRCGKISVIKNDDSEYVRVKIDGEVAKPGEYRVPSDYKVCDIIYCAGGITDRANLDNVNLTAVVTDSLSLHIPANGDDKNEAFCVININSASKEDLMLIPNIGEKTAEHIIEYRREHGAFKSVDDLKNIKGIGSKTLKKITEYIKTED